MAHAPGPEGDEAAPASASACVLPGRHRAPPRSPVRSQVAIGAAAVAVVAGGGIAAPTAVASASAALPTSGGTGPLRVFTHPTAARVVPAAPDRVPADASVRAAPGTSATSAVPGANRPAGGPAVAPVEAGDQRISSIGTGPSRTASVRVARARARDLLASRVKEIDAAAGKAATAAAVRSVQIRRGCGYAARIQRQPSLDAAQLRNVRAIIEVAKELGLPPRAAVIALATAQQESWLKNLNWGDRDSLGLFQQRPSMGWGSRSQVTDPKHAARAFYRALTEVSGWEHLPVTVAAQRVQRSAFGSRYARWELMAAKLVAKTLTVANADLSCNPR